ncbi:MAG: excinuclease ABC subunit UvrB [Patescibacteria group bacterium]|jgi:excinuclease ABC subunit B
MDQKFKLVAPWKPAGDQPEAIEKLTDGILSGAQKQTLLGVTGSGKTFTIANVIAKTQKPTLIIAPNKTLAAQLCQEFRAFFPENVVEYFVSYYDYYQPEAYMPVTDTYIEKESQINEEIDRLRHAATQALLTRKDVIIVASVSCIYSLGSPEEYEKRMFRVKKGDPLDRQDFIRRLVALYYERTNADVGRGQFRAMGDVLEIIPKAGNGTEDRGDEKMTMYRVLLENGRVQEILALDPVTRTIKEHMTDLWIFPAKHYVVSEQESARALGAIETELKDRLAELEKNGNVLEYERLSRRTRFDLEMIRNLGYCSGIENYSRHFDGRKPGEPPFTLLSYFPEGFLTVIDESHVTVPQIHGMYFGDKARKDTLVQHGFRLPSAKDNRPLTFDEFEARTNQTIYVSATPADFERTKSDVIVEQIVRPTGLIDPKTTICPVTADGEYPGQIFDLIERIKDRVSKNERTLVTTLTKKMAEDLKLYLEEQHVKVNYIHSDVETLKRIEILQDLRKGVYDVLVGVNLLREGLDLPEVSLVAILDADKEGFLRSETSLIQTIGRAARNLHGEVLLYADHMTGSLTRALKETDRRRAKQVEFNTTHGITPKGIEKAIRNLEVEAEQVDDHRYDALLALDLQLTVSPEDKMRVIAEKEEEMSKAASELRFETAARIRDEIEALKKE